MTLNLGSKLNPEDVKEGDDVYFECDVRANPHVNKIVWYHEVGATHPCKSTPNKWLLAVPSDLISSRHFTLAIA